MSESIDDAGELIAGPGREYRLKRGGFAVLMIALGLWFAYDGWVNWPAEQQRYDATPPAQQALMKKPHTDMDIFLQRALALTLTPLGLFLLPYYFHASRGQCRLVGNTLHLPGHPLIPIENIVELDKAKWERKGIAYIAYELSQPAVKGRAKLDDFAYQQEPIHAIVKRIEAHLRSDTAESAAAEATPSPSPATPDA